MRYIKILFLAFFLFLSLSLSGNDNPISNEFFYKPFNYNPYNFKPLSQSPYFFVGDEGKTNQIGGIYYDEIEKKYLIFSKTFLDMHTNLFVSGRVKLQSFNDLEKVPVGVVRGDFAQKYFSKNFPKIKLLLFENYEEVIISAIKGKILAFAQNFPNAMFFLSKYGALKEFKQYQLFDPKELKLENQPPVKETENQDELRSLIIKDIEKLLDKQKKAPNTENTNKEKNTAASFFSHWAVLLFIFIFSFAALFWLTWYFAHKGQNKRRGHLQPLKQDDWQKLILQGENDQIEFKASLRWDHRKNQANTDLEMVIAKTICAFLNTHGGALFIGIDDEGKPVGLEQDFVTLGKKGSRDGFLLRLTHVINTFLGKKFHQFIHSEMLSFQNQDICLTQVIPSTEPVFLQLKHKEEFFIRTSASSQALSLKETHDYINSHWKKR